MSFFFSSSSSSSGYAPPQYYNPPSRRSSSRRSESTVTTGTKPPQHWLSSASVTKETAPLPPPNLKVKRVDHHWSSWSKAWKYRNTGSSVVSEVVNSAGNNTDNDPWLGYCFVVVRKLPDPRQSGERAGEITFQVVVKSPYLLKACKDVIGQVPGISWTAEPLELDPQLLIAFFPQFEEYEKTLSNKQRTTAEEHVLATVKVLLEYLRKDYKATLARIAELTARGEITFDLLYAILVPRTVLITECAATGEPRAVQLLSAVRHGGTSDYAIYSLLCESVDSLEESARPGRTSQNSMMAGTAMSSSQPGGGYMVPAPDAYLQGIENSAQGKIAGHSFGRVHHRIVLTSFKGIVKINQLEAYPIKYHAQAAEMKATLLERGRKWASMKGIHHMQYCGTAAFTVNRGSAKNVIKYDVNSRIMIDRGNFIRLNPTYEMPQRSNVNANIQRPDFCDTNACGSPRGLARTSSVDASAAHFNVPTLNMRAVTTREENPLTDDELILTSPILYGFSLSDKVWLEFNVRLIAPVTWNEEAFAGLVLAPERKDLLRSLVDTHATSLGFDDFVQGKGQGLIINLFGPPGVGKTLSAEATSEHTRRPLYVVGGGDLGTSAAELDARLERVFDIATSWKAIVLIDEADVFLERRSLHDLERNAMVAVFLRHIEYYRGILFLTTNRITAFDPAFLSRIHVALNFGALTPSARAQVWRAFLRKAGVADAPFADKLAARELNGRQIKNACRTAMSLAMSRGEPLGFVHLSETLDAMEEFTTEFAALLQHE